MKAITAQMTSGGTVARPSVIGRTTRGCRMRTSSRWASLTSTSMRTILIPPPVEPAQDTKQPRNSSSTGTKVGHSR